MTDLFDVAIIGAGASGLAAARMLSEAGRRIVILEARDRLGGRIDTRRFPDWPGPIELGAEFIHGHAEALWEILKEAKLQIQPGDERRLSVEEGRLTEDNEEEEETSLLSIEEPTDLTIAEKLSRAVRAHQISPEEARMLRGYVEGFYATYASEVSAQSIAIQEKAAARIQQDRSYRVLGGYDLVPSWLWSRLSKDRASLHLSTVLYEVRWQRGFVELKARSAEGIECDPLRAKRLLLTVPLGVLQAPKGAEGAISFSPSLPDWKEEALRGLGMGNAIKAIFLLQKSLWEKLPGAGTLNFFFHTQQDFPTWWTWKQPQTPVLVGWAAGAATEALRGLGATELRQRAVRSLAGLLDLPLPTLEPLIVDCRCVDWANDPFSRGAYSFVRVGNFAQVAALSAPIEETLFFAGEATHAELSGSVHGALLSGQRAAEEILRSLSVKNIRHSPDDS